MLRIVFLLLVFCTSLQSQDNPFRQLGTELPTPNNYRTGAGTPGPDYYQNKADYVIHVKLDEVKQTITGDVTITYTNNAPEPIYYLWVQLDQNKRALDSDSYLIQQSKFPKEGQYKHKPQTFDGGFKINTIKDSKGNKMPFHIVKTMMRVYLDRPLDTNETITFSMEYYYNINDRMAIGGRSGYEYFQENDNYLYTIAQFYPRMCVFDDIEGWQNKQFLGRGEFAVPFGDYDVSITVPSDHLVAATGTLQNSKYVLTKKQLKLLDKAKNSFEQPVIIFSEQEARKNEKTKSKDFKTWHFKADNVRDFAFASSRKFIWDAMNVKVGKDKTSLAMSMYPKEGNPLWEKYSTKAVAHTLKWYSHYTIDYPYPVAWSINAKSIGMEYPMISFNYGRCFNGKYSKRTKYGMISVIIHEIGHNYFPMIINSDERQWTWMDEGVNSYVQFITEQEWERDYPSRRGEPGKIVSYMSSNPESMEPIMINSESIKQFGNNSYGKPATALNILRESVVGRENFDFAFKQYCTKWKFKHPSPADLFRTLEDASAIDLDWFWRGWFFTTDATDMAIKNVQAQDVGSQTVYTPDFNPTTISYPNRSIASIRNEVSINKTYDEYDLKLFDEYSKENQDIRNTRYSSYKLKKHINKNKEPKHFYEVTFQRNGLIMPIIVQLQYLDGTYEDFRFPAEIWKMNNKTFTKVFPTSKKVQNILLDPYSETADIVPSNNIFPNKVEEDKFKQFKNKKN